MADLFHRACAVLDLPPDPARIDAFDLVVVANAAGRGSGVAARRRVSVAHEDGGTRIAPLRFRTTQIRGGLRRRALQRRLGITP